MVREFSKEELIKIEELAQTKTSVEIAEYFGLTRTTFKYLKKKYPDLREAIDRGNEAGGNYPKRRVYKKKMHVFTQEDLVKIENLVVHCSYREVAENIGLAEHQFLALRKTNSEVKEALERGVAKRGDNFIRSQRDKKSKNIKNGKAVESSTKVHPLEYDEISALQKFKKEFEENKIKRLKRELSEIDLI